MTLMNKHGKSKYAAVVLGLITLILFCHISIYARCSISNLFSPTFHYRLVRMCGGNGTLDLAEFWNTVMFKGGESAASFGWGGGTLDSSGFL